MKFRRTRKIVFVRVVIALLAAVVVTTVLVVVIGSGNVEEVKVWKLNPTTGGWDFTGDLTQETDDDQLQRKKRQITQGG